MDVGMSAILTPIARRHPDGAALIDEERMVTWAELDRRVGQLAHWLRNNVAPDSTAAVLAHNSSYWYEILLASMHSATTLVPINRHLTATEVAYILDDAGVAALFVDDACAEVGAHAIGRAARSINTVRIGTDLDGLVAEQQLLADAEQTSGSLMFYTSGTTGVPKGVRSSSLPVGGPVERPRDVGALMCSMLNIPLDGTTLLIGPAYHSAQWALSVFPLLNGSTLVTTRKFDAADTLRLIEQHRVTNFHAVPTQFVRMLQLPDSERSRWSLDTLQVVIHGAAPCTPSVKRAMIDWIGPRITEYYGATETGFVSVIDGATWIERPTSVGRPLPYFEVKVLDAAGTPQEPGNDGELWFRNLLGADFEYHRDANKTAASHLDGMFTVGDIGSVDADGYIHLSDRKIDMIISGGVNIYPAEIEAVLAAHPAVAQAAVIGVPNDEFGEEVKAVIELHPGWLWSDEVESELRRDCRRELAGYKQPRSFDIVNELPRSEAGKILKRELREPYWAATGGQP
jgi:long-chain acyl-CoA synthetase